MSGSHGRSDSPGDEEDPSSQSPLNPIPLDYRLSADTTPPPERYPGEHDHSSRWFGYIAVGITLVSMLLALGFIGFMVYLVIHIFR